MGTKRIVDGNFSLKKCAILLREWWILHHRGVWVVPTRHVTLLERNCVTNCTILPFHVVGVVHSFMVLSRNFSTHCSVGVVILLPLVVSYYFVEKWS